jgi:hypothetical protein
VLKVVRRVVVSKRDSNVDELVGRYSQCTIQGSRAGRDSIGLGIGLGLEQVSAFYTRSRMMGVCSEVRGRLITSL